MLDQELEDRAQGKPRRLAFFVVRLPKPDDDSALLTEV